MIEIDLGYSLLELVKNIAVYTLITYGVASAALLLSVVALLKIRRLNRKIKTREES